MMRGFLDVFGGRDSHHSSDEPFKIVINAHGGALFEGLAQLLEEHIVNAAVFICEDLKKVGSPDPLVRLLLVHASDKDTVSGQLEMYRTLFPEADVAILGDSDAEELDWKTLGETSEVQGYLPLDLKLPVFLAAVSLVLSGGQFFPVRPFKNHAVLFKKDVTERRNLPDRQDASHNVTETRTNQPELRDLTSREHQILMLLAQGLQNKLIADRMQLSEHTVKAHVHNLMGKLKVTNRTQAAAAFHGLGAHTNSGGQNLSMR